MRSARALFVAFVSAVAAASTLSGQQPSVDPSKANFERLCGTCHEPERGTSSRRTRDQWFQIVNSMIARGAQGTDAEFVDAIEYLTREHGRVNMNLANGPEIAGVLGLTPAEAEAIVQYRRERGAFEDAAGVARVPGVDAKKLAARTDAMVFGSRVVSNAGRVPVAALTAANNWPGVSGGPQREGWARPETMLSRSTVNAVQLLYTRKLDNRSRGARALTPPLVLGNLISYRGFKEMLFVGGSADVVYSIDAVLNRVLWTTRLPVALSAVVAANPETCPGGLAGIVMTGTAASGFGTSAIRRPGSLPPGVLPAAATAKSGLVVGLSNGFGRNGLLLSVGSDGRIFPLYQSNGALFETPISFLPPNSNARSVGLFDNTLYASNTSGCGDDAVYAIDLASEDKAIAKFQTRGSVQGSAGPAIGNDGTVYVHAGDRLIALTAKNLKEKGHFVPPNSAAPGMTPLVFTHNQRDVVIAGSGSDVLLLDSAAFGGADHRTPIARAQVEGTVRGAFASWEDPDSGTRWIYAPLSSAAGSGGLAAFTFEERDGRPVLTSRWTVRDITSPAPPVVANGLVFVLSTGSSKIGARIYILDAANGKELFTSRDTVAETASPEMGLAVANGRVYFSTTDNTLYCFGIPTEH